MVNFGKFNKRGGGRGGGGSRWGQNTRGDGKKDFSGANSGQVGGFKKRFNGNFTRTVNTDPSSSAAAGSTPTSKDESSEARVERAMRNDAIDNKFGFERIQGHVDEVGWLLNMHPTEILDDDKRLISAVDYYFIKEDGNRFRATMAYSPYFYVLAKKGFEIEVQLYLTKKYGAYISGCEIVRKEDLDLPNHLVGLKQKYLKLSFRNTTDLMRVRKDILPAAKKNREREKSKTAYDEMMKQNFASETQQFEQRATDHLENIIDIREHDVPYHMRVSIDKKIFVGLWYSVQLKPGTNSTPVITRREDLIESPDCIILAYDIETTKLPLKFPDSSFDQIMMISYMLDGQGYLITNREIVSSDVDNFEYTPRPEFEGKFTVFNEQNEMQLIQRFFDHILDVKPHIFVTYNGDFFDWPFVEARAKFHGLSMVNEIGFAAFKEGIYSCRSCIHMDCFNWVKRDSYLPVGSQNLKAVAKSKLRYDPVELDPEDMCRMAVEQPQVLSTYSVSDAVATYYLYMKYVHPFIFALCTIIPLEPDEVLRKGTGTLCEALLMVEAYHVNVIFPNKQETVLNKMTDDGHVLDQETYVGGHVEALESGVFRSDIPCRFKLVPEAFTELINGVESTLKHTLEEEEHISLDKVTNFTDVVDDIKNQLAELRDNPIRQEYPLIYHLDVGAMYPNIILTNRLQPSAIVDEVTCAACDFNKPDAKCQRKMGWTWRGEFMPASRSEFQRIQQQLEMEKFPPQHPGGPSRAFHELSDEERSVIEKKRLTEYCKKAYRKTHITRTELRYQTVCMQENSFYVDTVRAFRDRRYEYKGFSKVAKKELSEALKKGDAVEIKSAKNREVLYDSLQLAYKCILNSFYGYVMRRGSRWMSMEMAGIVCHTGGNIIRKAREIIEKVGRPLELDTDGIWCCLPSSFPENYTFYTTDEKKAKVTISYPNAVLNLMVKTEFTNDQYHDLVNPETLEYKVRKENSIFFEVDGPYLAMILPASKEEGKRLKKRYAVYNKDGSLAELKGFEVKRRGELQLIKIFQSSVFDAFLKGDTLEGCYAHVAKVADYWLDVLYSKAEDMPDSELFELISENRSMSRKLEDYGQQKSTSISTAKRLAEFLGDQMIKDAGLSCRFVISRKPDGAPVTERAVPLAIFQSEPSVKHHFIRRWLKDNSIVDFDIRSLLDWDYYIERLSGTIQKIITIPAAMQGVPNPVPRVAHPEWLHKRILEKTDVWKQRKINELFQRIPKPSNENREEDIGDIEEIGGGPKSRVNQIVINSTNRKRNRSDEEPAIDYTKDWREVLGPAPAIGNDKESITEWLKFHKKKWEYQKKQKEERNKRLRINEENGFLGGDDFIPRSRGGDNRVTIGGFLRRAQQTLLDLPWQVIQIVENGAGVFKLWALVGQELHQIRLNVPRIFYMNLKDPKPLGEAEMYRKCTRILPRSNPVFNLYEYSIPEDLYKMTANDIAAEVATPTVEGLYETQVPLDFRVLVQLGCVCSVDRNAARRMKDVTDTFDLNQLTFRSINADFPYMDFSFVKYVWLYQHKSGSKSLFGLFSPTHKKGTVFALDTVRTDQMPNLVNAYNQLRNERLAKESEDNLPESGYAFDVKVETDIRRIYRHLQNLLTSYKDEKRGPTVLLIQTQIDNNVWTSAVPATNDFPMIRIHVSDMDNLYHQLDWQKVATRMMLKHYFRLNMVLKACVDQSKYFQVPIGNIPEDTTIFGCDLFYARSLVKQNFVLWCSPTERPDLGGKEAFDNRLITEFEEHNSIVLNNPGCYQSVCIELELDGLAVNTLLQAHHVHDIEGTSATVAFDTMPQASLEEMMGNAPGPSLASYDESALCSQAFRVLRSMVGSWLRDVSVHRNVMADYQLIHFYRWLRSPQSLLYEPALKKTLHNLMKKLFIQLVAEFIRLGSSIVYADFNKIIICTKKNRVYDALGYVEYVTHSIRTKELFHSIDIKVTNCWKFLLWLDSANYGGIKGSLDPQQPPAPAAKAAESQSQKSKSKNGQANGNADEDHEENEDEEDNEEAANESQNLEPLHLSDDETEEEANIDMQWSLMHYLPDVGNCKHNFLTTVALYVTAMAEHLDEVMDGIKPGETPVHRRTKTPTPRRAHNAPIIQDTIEYARSLINEFTQRLFQIIQKLDKKYPKPVQPKDPTAKAIYRAPNYKSGKPALELIKALNRILSLDPNIENEVYKLRRNLLKLIGVGEFSDEAHWIDPYMSITLPEVICKVCVQCRDIDLCKDKHVKIENELPVWYCPTCESNYETAEIEQSLVDILNRKLMGFVLQDLQCKKCKEVKQDNMKEFCTCAGTFTTTVDAQLTTARLETFRGIALHFGMPLLLQNVEWILNMNQTGSNSMT